MDNKYVTFKRGDWEDMVASLGEQGIKVTLPLALHDAVVIRRQDAFAPPALDAYANAIQCVIETLGSVDKFEGEITTLRGIADYFHEQAAKSWVQDRKLPD